MRRLLLGLIWACLLIPAGPVLAEMSSQDCVDCHDDAELVKEVDGKKVSLRVNKKEFGATVHGELECADCHSNIKEEEHAGAGVNVVCGECHEDAQTAYDASGHGVAWKRGNQATATCASCHGKVHVMLGSDNPKARTHKSQQLELCGSCHGDAKVMASSNIGIQPMLAYKKSVHGQALATSPDKTATCVSCHPAHDSRPANDPKSKIFKFNVGKTCGECHDKETKAFEGSVHGTSIARGNSQSPTCTNCHGVHMIRSKKEIEAVKGMESLSLNSCIGCHAGERLSDEFGVTRQKVDTYKDSYHGHATAFGLEASASCVSCHGVHGILPSSNPKSTVHKDNLLKTCAECHPGAGQNFIEGDVHLDLDRSHALGAVIIRFVRTFYVYFIFAIIAGMVLHNAIIWFRKTSARKASQVETVVRMNAFQRLQHILLLTSFLTLVVTGFALEYPDTWFGTLLFSSELVRRIVHRVAAFVMVGASVFHLGYVMFTAEGRKLIKDLWPRWQDAKDVLTAVNYYVFRKGERPLFHRFSYAEKAEYWALVWGVAIMGLTGFALMYKVQVGTLIPRWWVDVALAIHFYEAVLATLAIIVWHFYAVIFDPDVYPMNWAWFDGKMPKSLHMHEHPLEYTAEERAAHADESAPGPDGPAKH